VDSVARSREIPDWEDKFMIRKFPKPKENLGQFDNSWGICGNFKGICCFVLIIIFAMTFLPKSAYI
jgi:hypothetical protein